MADRIGVKKAPTTTKRQIGVLKQDVEPSGPALEQDRATQFGQNKSSQTTGNSNYKSPGSECGMS